MKNRQLIQDQALCLLLALPQQTNLRSKCYDKTLLNRYAMGIAKVRRQYIAAALAAEWSDKQIEFQWEKIKEAAILFEHCLK